VILWVTLCLISGVTYLLVSIWLSQGLTKITAIDSANLDHEMPSIAVLVAARNEENSVPTLLDSLLKQSYPSDRFTVTIINDRSDDMTSDVVRQYQSKMSNLNLIEIESIPEGVAIFD